LELADLVKSLRQHWRISVACVLLGVVGLALFLVTRNQVAPAHRYKVEVTLLVPAITPKGGRPAGVPPGMLQDQNRVALSPATIKATFDAAKIPARNRRGISFIFHAAATDEIITIGATAHDPKIAATVAVAFQRAYTNDRKVAIAAGLKGAAAAATTSLAILQARLTVVRDQLKKVSPAIFATLSDTGSRAPTSSKSKTAPPTASSQLSLLTPISTIQLVVEHESLVARILGTETAYATNITQALVPESFSQVIEVGSASQITPPLPSSKRPALVFLGVGILLAFLVPIVLDRLDKSIRSAKTAAIAFDSVVMTSIPAASRRLQQALAPPGTPLDGAYRALAATSIATDRLPAAIVVTSPTGTVQDTVAANFAAALAGLGLRVALIATDARQSWFLDTRRDPDESGVPFPDLLELAHRGALDGTLPSSLVRTNLDKLVVLPPGEEDREVRLDGLRPLLETLSDSNVVDVTVIAGPAVLEDPNATILAWTTRSVLWAFETGEVTEGEAKEAASRVALAGATSFGIAMVNGKT
jgi:Mrp family chromosome partitioning ATPase